LARKKRRKKKKDRKKKIESTAAKYNGLPITMGGRNQDCRPMAAARVWNSLK